MRVKEPSSSFFNIVFKGVNWKHLFSSFSNLLFTYRDVKARVSLYLYIFRLEHNIPDDLNDEDFKNIYDLDDELYDFRYYKGWTETLPMFLLFFMFFTGSYSMFIFILGWSFDDFSEYFNNEFHGDNMDDNEPPDIDEFDSFVYEVDFTFYDSHTLADYNLLYYHYINRFRKSYSF